MKILTYLKVSLISYSLVLSSQSAFATQANTNYNIKELTLPSEVKDMRKSFGSVFFSPSVKGKVLVPVHFWGEVKNSGLHFVPVNTSFINGISMAGGPSSQADLQKVKITRKAGQEKLEVLKFDLSDGGNQKAYAETLRPGDSVFIGKDTFNSERQYYTSLFGVFATILSSILLYRQVKD